MTPTEAVAVKRSTLQGIIDLTRWKEQLPLLTLTFLGGLVAYSVTNEALDWRLVAVAAANFLTVTFAFMINDIEDADDDAENPYSAQRNPVTNGSLDGRTAWGISWLVFGGAVALYALGGFNVVMVGLLNLSLSFLYSWRPVRLKSSTIGLDVISHTLMLGGLLPLAGYYAYTSETHPAIVLAFAAATLGSTYGQLYNQLRDYDSDRKAGIKNVAIRMGKRITWTLAYTAIGMGVVTGTGAFLYMNYPGWLMYVIIASMIFGFGGMLVLKNPLDASGKPAQELSGRLQLGFWFAFTVTIGVWVMWAMGLFEGMLPWAMGLFEGMTP